MTIRLALQIPNFSYGTGVPELVLSPITNLDGYHPGRVTTLAEVLRPVLGV